MLARLDKNPKREPEEKPPDAVESEIRDLHDPIMQWAKNRVPALPLVHSNPYRKTTIGAGVPDFILGYRGRTLWIECKDKDGKLSPDQLAFKMILQLQGLRYDVIRTMREFFEIIAEIDREFCVPTTGDAV